MDIFRDNLQACEIFVEGFSLVLMLVMLLATTLLQFDVAREVLLIQIVAMFLGFAIASPEQQPLDQ